ncbi:MAG: DUF2905 domain-containing protein [Polyangiaceae bacterium]|nr:DUF2905 domain-containing protein [Polyangiaceae bacterium]
MAALGRSLLVLGGLMVLGGLALLVTDRFGLPRLPGDLLVERRGFRLYAPVATCILVSVVLTVLANLLLRR